MPVPAEAPRCNGRGDEDGPADEGGAREDRRQGGRRGRDRAGGDPLRQGGPLPIHGDARGRLAVLAAGISGGRGDGRTYGAGRSRRGAREGTRRGGGSGSWNRRGPRQGRQRRSLGRYPSRRVRERRDEGFPRGIDQFAFEQGTHLRTDPWPDEEDLTGITIG